MTKQIEAVYENGMLRPIDPLNVPEGEHLHLIIITRKGTGPNGSAGKLLAEIAALPIEGQSDAFSGSDHDTVLYPKTS